MEECAALEAEGGRSCCQIEGTASVQGLSVTYSYCFQIRNDAELLSAVKTVGDEFKEYISEESEYKIKDYKITCGKNSASKIGLSLGLIIGLIVLLI